MKREREREHFSSGKLKRDDGAPAESRKETYDIGKKSIYGREKAGSEIARELNSILAR